MGSNSSGYSGGRWFRLKYRREFQKHDGSPRVTWWFMVQHSKERTCYQSPREKFGTHHSIYWVPLCEVESPNLCLNSWPSKFCPNRAGKPRANRQTERFQYGIVFFLQFIANLGIIGTSTKMGGLAWHTTFLSDHFIPVASLFL